MKNMTACFRRMTFMLLAAIATLFAGCYGNHHDGRLPSVPVGVEADSTCFYETHHYGQNFNFVVKADSLMLVRQQPVEILSRMHTDTITVYRGDHVAVAEIRVLPTDSIDSVWVQIARDQETFGWLHESSLLPSVVPDDPISQFISTFSDVYLLIFLIVISVISVAYLMRTIFKRNARIVHFNDIPTFYPTALALTVAAAAVLYSSIRMFAQDTWQHFYFNPTLNPFIVPPALGIFLVSVWAMLIIGLATVDVVRGILPTGEAFLYLCGLAGVCALNYIIFSITTLYYVGYPLFIAYAAFAVYVYVKRFGRLYKDSFRKHGKST